jgi:hypothetical protein
MMIEALIGDAMPPQVTHIERYKGYRIAVNRGAYSLGTPPANWIFSIYRESDGTLVYDKGGSKWEDAAHSAARKWIDEHPITKV